MQDTVVELCGTNGCRLIKGHTGQHKAHPKEAWSFMGDADKNKIDKAGYATPRGGDKGAYQNHVYRNNRVIIPYERFEEVSLSDYADGYVVRLYPDQYFDGPGQPKAEFAKDDAAVVVVGRNAFILYRSHSSLEEFPPPDEWKVRGLLEIRGGVPTPVSRRGRDVLDTGHVVYRLASQGKDRPGRSEGPPQGIFAPEYATAEDNYLSQVVLAWLIVRTIGSPYTREQADHLQAILEDVGIADVNEYERNGVLRLGYCDCPLCMRFIRYEELHATVAFAEEGGLENAAEQVEGSTRSTAVNLFHLDPLSYSELRHTPMNVAWGHAICNTRLGQRKVHSIADLSESGREVAIVGESANEHLGWISADGKMVRSPRGAVWIRLHGDVAEHEVPDVREESSEERALGSERILVAEQESVNDELD